MADEPDYSGYPQSITEIKAHQTKDAKSWTPKDALIHLLRDIDNGRLDVECLVIAFRCKPDESDISKTGYSRASLQAGEAGHHETLGLHMEVQHMMMHGQEEYDYDEPST